MENLITPNAACERYHKSLLNLDTEELIFRRETESSVNSYRLTPVIVTLHEEILTYIDIKILIELGMNLVRFRMTHIARNDKIIMLNMVKKAQEWLCRKFEVRTWPVAICMDIPNAAIRTGYIDKKLKKANLWLHEGKFVKVTSNIKFKEKMNFDTIYIDDHYTIEVILPGCELTFINTAMKLACVQVIDKETIKCKVIRRGSITSNEFVSIRGTKYKRPPLGKFDLDILAVAKELKSDHLSVFSVRYGLTIKRIRKLCGEDYNPLILSTICEQEGVDNIDEIIEASDGIILARELLIHQLTSNYNLHAIQMQICAKCKMRGKPFFLSGNILEHTNDKGFTPCDLADVTNGVLEGAGFMIRHYSDAATCIIRMQMLDEVCKFVESVKRESEFWRLIDEYRMPLDAAEASVIGCVLMAKQTNSSVIVLPTVSGRTAMELTRMAPHTVILTISRSPTAAKKLQLFRAVCPVIYEEPQLTDWYEDMQARVKFAIKYGVKQKVLDYGDTYVILKKSSPYSAFPDNISVWTVSAELALRKRMECKDDQDIKTGFQMSDKSLAAISHMTANAFVLH